MMRPKVAPRVWQPVVLPLSVAQLILVLIHLSQYVTIGIAFFKLLQTPSDDNLRLTFQIPRADRIAVPLLFNCVYYLEDRRV